MFLLSLPRASHVQTREKKCVSDLLLEQYRQPAENIWAAIPSSLPQKGKQSNYVSFTFRSLKKAFFRLHMTRVFPCF
jgi:hypothetical protein